MQPTDGKPQGHSSTQKELELRQLIKEGCDSIDRINYDRASNERAEKSFEDALKIDSKNRMALSGLGMAQSLLEKWDSALANYEKVLVDDTTVDKCYLYALRGKGYCLINLKKFSESVDVYDRYTLLNPGEWRGWFNKGYSLIILEKYEESDKCFEKFFEVDHNKPGGIEARIDAFNYRGFAAYNLNNLEKADKFFDLAYAEDPLSFGGFGAKIGKKLVQEKRYYIQQQQELIETAKKYLTCLLKDFRRGLSIVQYMFIIQFFTGLGLLIYALLLAASGNTEILTYIAGATGGLIAILSLIFSAPSDLQKNRVDFSQWMIAYFNWINALYAVSGAITQKTKDMKEIKWEEIELLQDYLSKVTSSTITTIEQCCEFSNKSKFSIPGLSSATTTISDSENTATVQTETETIDTSQGTQPDQSQNTSNAPEPKDQGTTEKPKQIEPSKVTMPSTDDIIAQMQKLADLQKSGVLTDEEFTLAKKKLLGV
jgi:tetratricopeptide (TPR) repeat protein